MTDQYIWQKHIKKRVFKNKKKQQIVRKAWQYFYRGVIVQCGSEKHAHGDKQAFGVRHRNEVTVARAGRKRDGKIERGGVHLKIVGGIDFVTRFVRTQPIHTRLESGHKDPRTPAPS